MSDKRCESTDQNTKLLEQRLQQMEKLLDEHDDEIEDLKSRVAGHDTSIAKIEILVEGLKTTWMSLERDIRNAMESNKENNAHQAWKEVTIEAIKTISVVAGAILAAKIFLG